MKSKKKYFVALALFSAILVSNAQIDFGLKAGLNYNSNGKLTEEVVTNVNDIKEGDGKAKSGYNVGMWLNFEIPIIGLFAQPELVYTSTESSYSGHTYSLQKIDVPVLFGTDFLSIAKFYIGPTFQFILDSDFEVAHLKEIKTSDFSVGLNVGAGVRLGKIGLDLRYERGLSKLESIILTDELEQFKIDARSKQLIFGVTYQF